MKRLLKAAATITILLAVCLGCTVFANADSAFSGGSGTEKDPYLISTAGDLREMAKLINNKNTGKTYNSAYYLLTNDVDVSGKKWVPIGYPAKDEYFCFEGTFDGGNHSISGIEINYKDPAFGKTHSLFGLFGHVQGDALIKDLTIKDSKIICKGKSGVCAAAVAAKMNGQASIENCSTADDVSVEGNYKTAGICAEMGGDATIIKCSNAANVKSEKDAAGIVCSANSISDCSNSGNVVSVDGDAAGIAVTSRSSITNCSNSGSISADVAATVLKKAAGIVCSFGDGALNKDSNNADVKLSDCFNDGKVSGGIAGGIAAKCYSGSIEACTNSGAITAAQEAGGILGFFQISPFGTACEEFKVIDCANSASVSSTANMCAGGICGMIYGGLERAVFENCSNSGSITAEGETDVMAAAASAGGMIGESRVTELKLQDCANSARITGMGQSGGLVGSARPGQDSTDSAFSCVGGSNSGNVCVKDPGGLTQYIYVGGMAGKLIDDTESGKDQPAFDKITVEQFKNNGKLSADNDGAEVRKDDISFAYNGN